MKKGINQSIIIQTINHLFLNLKHVGVALYTLVFCILLSGCAQITSLQTAKTLPKDEQIIGVSASAYGINQASFVGGDVGLPVYPHVEVFGRQGFSNKFDAGLKISSSGNIAIDGKYQFLGNAESKFALASGLALEYQFVPNFETFVSRQTVPVYVSFHPNSNFAVYVVPKFMHQWVSDDESFFFLGNNLGLQKRLTKRFSMIAEGSLFWLFDQQFTTSGNLIYQGGLGFVFDL